MSLALLLAACLPLDEPVKTGDDVGVDPEAPEPVPDTDDASPRDTAPPPDTSPPRDTAPPVDTAPPAPQEIRVLVTADDGWLGWLDGVPFSAAAQTDWQRGDELVFLVPQGRHVLAFHAQDRQRVISGFIAAVWVSIELYSVTGDGRWKVTDVAPDGDWTALDYDDGAFTANTPCGADAATWGTYWPAPFYDVGAAWIWSKPCRELGQAWLRLVIE